CRGPHTGGSVQSTRNRSPRLLVRSAVCTHHRYPERTFLTIALGDVDTPSGLRRVAPVGQRVESGAFRLRRVPALLLHSPSACTSIGNHSQNGRSAAGKRVREQIDQCFDLPPSALR